MTDSKDGKNESTERLEETRREVLARTGRLVYTAPVMTTLLGATKVRATAVISAIRDPTEKI